MRLIRSVLEVDPKFAEIGLAMGVTFGGAASNNVNNTHLLLIMHAILSHKIVLHELTNRTQLKKLKRPGTTYAKYSRLMQNSYKKIYMHIITVHTQMLPSWGFAGSASEWNLYCELSPYFAWIESLGSWDLL